MVIHPMTTGRMEKQPTNPTHAAPRADTQSQAAGSLTWRPINDTSASSVTMAVTACNVACRTSNKPIRSPVPCHSQRPRQCAKSGHSGQGYRKAHRHTFVVRNDLPIWIQVVTLGAFNKPISKSKQQQHIKHRWDVVARREPRRTRSGR